MQPATPTPAPAAAPASQGVTATSSQAPTAINLPQVPTYDTAGTLDAIRNYYQIPEQTATMAANAKAQAYNANVQDQNNRAAAAQRAQAEADKLDPNKYTFRMDPTGATPTKIFDSQGNQVSIADFTRLTGANPAQYLKGSNNTNEQKFLEAYNNYEGFMKALINGDKTTLSQYFQKNPGLQNMKPDDVRRLFMQQYGTYFGVPQANVPYGVNQAFIPGSSGSTALTSALAALGG